MHRCDALSASNRQRLLEQALPLLRCPSCGYDELKLLSQSRSGLRCADCSREYRFAEGVLDLYTGPEIFTLTQRSLQGGLSTCLYERFRWLLGRLLVGYTMDEEAERFARVLDLKPGDTLLDVACGPANFTVELAQRTAPGLVIGLDVSPAQLARAASAVARSGLSNVLLVRGDVHRLPLRTGVLGKVNCAGGLHQFPDPEKAISELARTLVSGGQFSGSTCARHPARFAQRLQAWMHRCWSLHWVDLVGLQKLVEKAGFRNYQGELAPIPWFGYYRAERA